VKATSVQCHCCGTMYGYMILFDLGEHRVFRCSHCDEVIRAFLNAGPDEVEDELWRIGRVGGLMNCISYNRSFEDEQWTLDFKLREIIAPFTLRTHDTSNPTQYRVNPAFARAKRQEAKKLNQREAQEFLTEIKI
jgi:hypothetical protein